MTLLAIFSGVCVALCYVGPPMIIVALWVLVRSSWGYEKDLGQNPVHKADDSVQ